MSSASPSPSPAASNVIVGAPIVPPLSASTVFRVSPPGSQRELIDASRAKELLHPLLQAAEADDGTAKHITKIVLSGKSFGADSASLLNRALASTPALEHFDMSDCIAGRATEEALTTLELLCQAISANPSIQLTHINFSDNAVGVRGIPKIKEAFKDQKRLQHVYFNNDGLQAEAVRGLTELIMANAQDGVTDLRTFEIAHNCMEDAGFLALIPLINASPNLERLRIATTRVRNNDGAGTAMAKALLPLRRLTALALNDNNLGLEAGQLLAEVIRNNAAHLTHLTLGDIGVEEEGIDAVLDAIRTIKPNTLQELDLSANELTAASCRKLASIIRRQRSSLRHLKLEDNELHSSGVRRLLRSLRGCTHLTYLNLNNTQLGERVGAELISFLRETPSLRELHLNANMFPANVLQDIRETLAQTGTEEALQTMSDNEEDEEEDEEEEEEDGGDEEEEEAEEAAASPDATVDALADNLAAVSVAK